MDRNYRPRPSVPTRPMPTITDFADQITALVTARVEAETQRDNWRKAEALARDELKQWKLRALSAEAKAEGQTYNAPRREYRINSGGKWIWRRWWIESRPVPSPVASTFSVLNYPTWGSISEQYKTAEQAYAAFANIQR